MEDGFADMGIECRERVLNDKNFECQLRYNDDKMKTNVKDLNFSVAIDGTTNTQPLFLTTGEGDTLKWLESTALLVAC